MQWFLTNSQMGFAQINVEEYTYNISSENNDYVCTT